MILCDKCTEHDCAELQRFRCILADKLFEFDDGAGFYGGSPARKFTTEEYEIIRATIRTIKYELEEYYDNR